ncbi:subtilisin-like protein [Lactarius psammicola]|nr:subtilisin-like protein [Lactarius psammicola]
MRYHCIFVLSVLTFAPLGGLATILTPRWEEMRSKHSWHAVPEDWECLDHPLNDTTIDLYVALRPHRKNALVDALYDVSTPGRPKYGAHLSKEQVAELVAPHPDTLELVHSWLEYRGIPSSSVSVTHGGSSLKLAGVSVSRANDLLGASYQFYKHVKTNETIVRTIGYALPAALHGHVQTVAPTTSFDSPRTGWQIPRKRFSGAAAGLAEAASGEPVTLLSSRDVNVLTTPSYLSWLYSTWVYSPTATDRNMLGIVGFLREYPSLMDLRLFMGKYRSKWADATFTVVLANGGQYDQNNPGDEANLDMQYAQGLAYPTRHVFYSTGRGPSGQENWNLSWLEYILKEEIVPQTISISYGNDEKDYSREDAVYLCDLFLQLASRGVSVLVATGDNGVGKGDCKDSSGRVQFVPTFPGTCPYVTSIGGTRGYLPEAASVISGGGFSNYFERPIWQQQAVPAFLQNFGNQYQGMYNASGRGIPDISAQAEGFRSFFRGQEIESFGTSGSAPIVASVISLLNDYLLSKGKHPLGFLNPWLYGGGLIALKDIIYGSNPGCGTNGFPAIAGWDPATGLGTPDFVRLQHRLDYRET